MSGYVLSILGIVIAGILIEILVPSGTINKYIRSIYSIFVIAVIMSPVIKLINKSEISFGYEEFQLNEKLLTYIFDRQVIELENTILNDLDESGFKNIDIKINYSINDNELRLNSCLINLSSLVILQNSSHINKYEFIVGVVEKYTNMKEEVIMIYE